MKNVSSGKTRGSRPHHRRKKKKNQPKMTIVFWNEKIVKEKIKDF